MQSASASVQGKSEALATYEARYAAAKSAKSFGLARLLKSAADAQAKLDVAVAADDMDAAEALDQELAAVEAQIAALGLSSPPVGPLILHFFFVSNFCLPTSGGS